MAHYSEGVRLWDISDPTDPREVAYYDNVPLVSGRFTGCWSVYPFFASGKIIASDMTYGLFVLRTDVTVSVEPSRTKKPDSFGLAQNYPNPFNPSTIISYDIPAAASVKLEIFNLRGRKVRTLVDEHRAAGRYETAWDGQDEAGELVGSGIYLYRITAGDFSKSRKMALIR